MEVCKHPLQAARAPTGAPQVILPVPSGPAGLGWWLGAGSLAPRVARSEWGSVGPFAGVTWLPPAKEDDVLSAPVVGSSPQTKVSKQEKKAVVDKRGGVAQAGE